MCMYVFGYLCNSISNVTSIFKYKVNVHYNFMLISKCRNARDWAMLLLWGMVRACEYPHVAGQMYSGLDDYQFFFHAGVPSSFPVAFLSWNYCFAFSFFFVFTKVYFELISSKDNDLQEERDGDGHYYCYV